MMEKFVCPNCSNSNPKYIGYRKGVPYCRLCLPFCGKRAGINSKTNRNNTLDLKYPLSEKQAKISAEVLKSLQDKKNVLIHAVTGAGKTELIYASVEYYLKQNLKVGFATPRKDVVIDLIPRFKESFPNSIVIAVYGEHTAELNGDIILLTTH